MRTKVELRRACVLHAPTGCNPPNKYIGQTPPSARVGVLQPHDYPLHLAPRAFTEQIPSTTRIPPHEPLNQYSPFSAGQEYYPSYPPPWTNFRHRRATPYHFVLPRNSILYVCAYVVQVRCFQYFICLPFREIRNINRKYMEESIRRSMDNFNVFFYLYSCRKKCNELKVLWLIEFYYDCVVINLI